MAYNLDSAAKDVEKEIKKVVNRILKEIGEEMRHDLAAKADEDVYGVYKPDVYIRRYTLDKGSNYKLETNENKMSVSVTPTAEFNRDYGGWNYGDELGGFMNFGNYWHGYVTNYNHPMPRPYITNFVEDRGIWDKIQKRLQEALGEWADVVDFNVFVGDPK